MQSRIFVTLKNVIKYIGRYLGRPVIATSRIDNYDGDTVTSITIAMRIINTQKKLFLPLISSKTEKPQKPYGFRGILYLNIMSSCDNKSIFRLYYSMIVATFPDPTVRPPSRYQNGVLQRLNGYFSFILWGKSGFSTVSVWFWTICYSWCYHGIPRFFSSINYKIS